MGAIEQQIPEVILALETLGSNLRFNFLLWEKLEDKYEGIWHGLWLSWFL